MTEALGVRQPLDHQRADRVAPGRPVGRLGERLDPAVRRQAALPAEVHEDLRRGDHRHAADERQRALVPAQRLRGQVQRDQRGGAGRVDGDGRTGQPEGTGDPGGERVAAAGQPVRRHVRGWTGEQHRVVVHAAAGVDRGRAAAQRRRVDAGPLQRLPGALQQQPLLRVHGQCLRVGDAEERRVEAADPRDESAEADVRGAGSVGVRVVEIRQVPAPIVGELADRVLPRRHQLPQVLGRADPGGHPAAHRDDRDRLARALLGGLRTVPDLAELDRDALEIRAQSVLVGRPRSGHLVLTAPVRCR